MKISKELLKELESLYSEYEKEVLRVEKDGYLKESTRKTYLSHSNNFIRWIKNDFEPGEKNK